jgi:hypothetical protein
VGWGWGWGWGWGLGLGAGAGAGGWGWGWGGWGWGWRGSCSPSPYNQLTIYKCLPTQRKPRRPYGLARSYRQLVYTQTHAHARVPDALPPLSLEFAAMQGGCPGRAPVPLLFWWRGNAHESEMRTRGLPGRAPVPLFFCWRGSARNRDARAPHDLETAAPARFLAGPPAHRASLPHRPTKEDPLRLRAPLGGGGRPKGDDLL